MAASQASGYKRLFIKLNDCATCAKHNEAIRKTLRDPNQTRAHGAIATTNMYRPTERFGAVWRKAR